MIPDIQDDGLLAQAAALAGATVAVVKHSGRRGTHEEFVALVMALEEARVEYPENPYVQALLTPETRQQIAGFAEQYAEVPKQTEVNDFKMAALNRCGQAAEWLEANASPKEAAEVKTSIIAACRRVASESKEGGPFNFTADNIDSFEVSAIEEVVRALGAN
jgi:hypothetical protein